LILFKFYYDKHYYYTKYISLGWQD